MMKSHDWKKGITTVVAAGMLGLVPAGRAEALALAL